MSAAVVTGFDLATGDTGSTGRINLFFPVLPVSPWQILFFA